MPMRWPRRPQPAAGGPTKGRKRRIAYSLRGPEGLRLPASGRERPVVLLDETTIRFRHRLRRTSVEAVARLLATQSVGGRSLDAFERCRQLHFQLIPLLKILLPCFGARGGTTGIETVGVGRNDFFVPQLVQQ